MGAKIYFLITFLVLFWTYCLYWGFKNQRKATTPVNFFIFDRQLPSWAFIAISTGTVFSGWIFFAHPGLIFMNGLPFAITSLAAIVIPLIGIIFLKRQWMLSKRFGFVTPCEMLGEYFKNFCLLVILLNVAIVLQKFSLEIYGSTMLQSMLITLSSFDLIISLKKTFPRMISSALMKYKKYVSELISIDDGISIREELVSKFSFTW